MKNSRERTVLGAVLIVAGLGLAADRFILGAGMTGPSESSAGVLDEVSASADALLIQPDPAAAAKRPGPTLADRLRRVTGDAASGQSDRDAFAVPESWLGTGADAELPMAPDLAQAAASFKQQHQLEAVLVTGQQRCAVVSGRTLYVGQELDGYRLVEVQERAAVFQDGRVKVRLTLPNFRAPS